MGFDHALYKRQYNPDLYLLGAYIQQNRASLEYICLAGSRKVGKKSKAAADAWSRDKLKVLDQADITNLTGNEKFTSSLFSSFINININLISIALVFHKNFLFCHQNKAV